MKGSTNSNFTLPNGYLYRESYREKNDYTGENVSVDFDQHTNLMFWDEQITRVFLSNDFNMYPGFYLGKTYLIFMGEPHLRAYEEINSDDDLWLLATRKVIADPKRKSGLRLSVEEWAKMGKLAFIGKPADCLTLGFEVTRVLYGSVGHTWKRNNKARTTSEVERCEAELKTFDDEMRAFILDYIGGYGRNESRSFAGGLVEDNKVNLEHVLKYSEIDFGGRYILNLK